MLFERYLKKLVIPMVSKHYRCFKCYYLAQTIDKEDLIQEVSIEIWQSYNKNKDRIGGDDLGKFINKSLKNILCSQKTRFLSPKKSHRLKYKLSLDQMLEDGKDFEVFMPEPQILFDSLSNILTRKEIKILKQKFIVGKTYKELALSLNISERYVYDLYHEILKKLKLLII